MGMKFLNVHVDDRIARVFATGAAIRRMTQAEYLEQLLELHRFVRGMAWDLTDETKTKHVDEEWEGPVRWQVDDVPDAEVVDELGGHLQVSHMLERRG
jgi:hypothetical protein